MVPSALAGNVRGVDAESGASLGRTQDEGVVVHYVEDEDAASGRSWPAEQRKGCLSRH